MALKRVSILFIAIMSVSIQGSSVDLQKSLSSLFEQFPEDENKAFLDACACKNAGHWVKSLINILADLKNKLDAYNKNYKEDQELYRKLQELHKVQFEKICLRIKARAEKFIENGLILHTGEINFLQEALFEIWPNNVDSPCDPLLGVGPAVRKKQEDAAFKKALAENDAEVWLNNMTTQLESLELTLRELRCPRNDLETFLMLCNRVKDRESAFKDNNIAFSESANQLHNQIQAIQKICDEHPSACLFQSDKPRGYEPALVNEQRRSDNVSGNGDRIGGLFGVSSAMLPEASWSLLRDGIAIGFILMATYTALSSIMPPLWKKKKPSDKRSTRDTAVLPQEVSQPYKGVFITDTLRNFYN